MKYYLLLSFSISFLFTGCLGSTQAYTYQGDNNLFLNTKKDSDVTAWINIYLVDNNCQTFEQGTTKIGDEHVKIALKPDQLYYLIFNFHTTGSFLNNSTSTISMPTLLQTHSKEKYSINASYLDGLYDINMRAKVNGSDKVRNLQLIPLNRCRPI